MGTRRFGNQPFAREEAPTVHENVSRLAGQADGHLVSRVRPAEVQSPFEAHPRIFVVDDEISIAKMMSVILQMNLFDAVPFSDPKAALDAALVNPPDYLISDIAMQGMTGIELAVMVQREIPSCKIILFSGQVGAAEMIQDARREGHSFAFLQKPIPPTELVKAIKNL